MYFLCTSDSKFFYRVITNYSFYVAEKKLKVGRISLIFGFACSLSGTDIILWHGKTGKILGNVDTNQLKNTMAAISPNGRFIAAAAFTADVKVTSFFIDFDYLLMGNTFLSVSSCDNISYLQYEGDPAIYDVKCVSS